MKTDLKNHLNTLIKAVGESTNVPTTTEGCVNFSCQLSQNISWTDDAIAITVIISLIGIVAVGGYV